MGLNWRNKDTTKDTPESVIGELYGFSTFRGMQRKAIGDVLGGDNSLYVAPTGMGKSLCYQVPAIMQERGTVTLVTTPLIALMRDQVRKLKSLGIPAGMLHSDMTAKREDILQSVRDGSYAMMYMSPEQLLKDDVVDTLKNTRKAFMAIDEAHCISQWGHDFRPAYGALERSIEACGFEYSSSFTATASPAVQRDIQRSLDIDNKKVRREKPLRENLSYGVTQLDDRKGKIDRIADLIEEYAPNKDDAVIVYCGTRHQTDHIASLLGFRNIRAQFYHGEMAGKMRRDVETRFMLDSPRVLAATNAFGMGIDKPNIRLVIHEQLPSSVQNYLQETGRAGRDGKPAHCELLYAPEDRGLHDYFIERKSPPMEFVRGVYLNLLEAESNRFVKPGDFFSVDMFRFYRLFDKKRKWDIETNELRVNSAFVVLEQAGVIERSGASMFRMLKPLEGKEEKTVKELNAHRLMVNRFHLDQMMAYAGDEKPSQKKLITMLGRNPS